jgi:hypothetical protein
MTLVCDVDLFDLFDLLDLFEGLDLLAWRSLSMAPAGPTQTEHLCARAKQVRISAWIGQRAAADRSGE